MGGIFGGLHGFLNWWGGWVLCLFVGRRLAWRTSKPARWLRVLLGGASAGVILGGAKGTFSFQFYPTQRGISNEIWLGIGEGVFLGVLAALVVEALYLIVSVPADSAGPSAAAERPRD
jgi:hypothetical protein